MWEEGLVGECSGLLSNGVLQFDTVDKWQWYLKPDKGYLIRGVYQMLTTTETLIQFAQSNQIWHKEVPLKVTNFAWRFLRERLPTKDNLLRRDILYHDNHLCAGGAGMEETTNHLFLSCPIFDTIWYQLRHWFGISGVDYMALTEQFFHFGQLGVSVDELVDKVKLLFFWWLKSKHVNFAFSYHCWWLNPLACLGITV